MRLSSLILFTFLLSGFASDPGNVLSLGTFTTHKRPSSHTLCAPHGGYDLATDFIATRVGEQLGWNTVTATGFRTDDHPYNVNRPTEGANLSPEKELFTEDADTIYRALLCRLSPFRGKGYYVELHGNSRPENIRIVEIATVGFSTAQSEEIKIAFLNAFKASHLETFSIHVEGVDDIYFGASATKKWGTFSQYSPALHIELPYALRTELQASTISALTHSLVWIEALFHE